MMKLGAVIPYLKIIQEIHKSHNAPLYFCWNQHFFNKSQYIKKYRYRLHFNAWFLIYLTFFESLRWLAWLKQNCFFMDWFYYNLIILIKSCKIPHHKILDKILLFSRNQVFCLKIWKLWRAPTTLQFNIFCWNFARFLLTNVSKSLCGIFFYFI